MPTVSSWFSRLQQISTEDTQLMHARTLLFCHAFSKTTRCQRVVSNVNGIQNLQAAPLIQDLKLTSASESFAPTAAVWLWGQCPANARSRWDEPLKTAPPGLAPGPRGC